MSERQDSQADSDHDACPHSREGESDDAERVRQVMEQYVDDEFLASKLGLEEALLQLCATVRQKERAVAFKDAAMIVSDFRRLDQDTLWLRYKTLTPEAALEAAASESQRKSGQ